MKKIALLTTIMLLVAGGFTRTYARDYDFLIDGIYYSILTDDNLAVSVVDVSIPSTAPYWVEITIPSKVYYGGTWLTVKEIGSSAFSVFRNNEDHDLSKLTLPNTIEIIRGSAFYGISPSFNTNGAYQTLPSSLRIIESYAFGQCGISEVKIPASVESIGYYAFGGFWDSCPECEDFHYVYAPDIYTVAAGNKYYSSIDGVLFDKMQTKIITVPDGYSADNTLHLPNTLKEYKPSWGGGYVNKFVVNGKTWYEADKNEYRPGWYHYETYYDEDDYDEEYPHYRIVGYRIYDGNTPLGPVNGKVNIPDGTQRIGDYTFYDTSEMASITIPNSVTSIGKFAFYNCSGLTSVTIPNSVTSIGDGAFRGCSGLTSVTIPNSVTSIGSSAFYNCNMLTTVVVEKKSPFTIDSYTFSNRANATLYVPKGSKAAYQSADYWKDFKSIVEFPDADVNQDGKVNVVDVVDIARFVVGTPSDKFMELLADLNSDDEVNVADAVVLVNEIAGDQNFAKAYGAPRQDLGDDRLTLTENGDHSLSLAMESQHPYTAFQFDLYTNSEDDVMNLRLNTARKNGHQLISNKVDEGHYRVVALSVANNGFNGNNGELLNIQLDGVNTDNVTISNIHFITSDGTDYRFDDLSLSSATGIEGLTPSPSPKGEGNVYDLSGRKVSESSVLPKGVYVVNGKKVIAK